MSTAALYALLVLGLMGLASSLAGLALLHAAWGERER
jgi:hypothetical protein